MSRDSTQLRDLGLMEESWPNLTSRSSTPQDWAGIGQLPGVDKPHPEPPSQPPPARDHCESPVSIVHGVLSESWITGMHLSPGEPQELEVTSQELDGKARASHYSMPQGKHSWHPYTKRPLFLVNSGECRDSGLHKS